MLTNGQRYCKACCCAYHHGGPAVGSKPDNRQGGLIPVRDVGPGPFVVGQCGNDIAQGT